MIKLIIAFFIGIHGLIHLVGFVKAFNWAEISPSSKPISKTWGIVWATIGLLLCLTAIAYIMELETWITWMTIGIIGSQLLIIKYWKDAKFGSIPNILIAAFLIWNVFFP